MGEKSKIPCLSREPKCLKVFHNLSGDRIPRATQKELKCAIFDLKNCIVRMKERGYIGQFGNSKHIIERDFSKEPTIKGTNETRDSEEVIRNLFPIDPNGIVSKKNTKVLERLIISIHYDFPRPSVGLLLHCCRMPGKSLIKRLDERGCRETLPSGRDEQLR